MLNKSFWYDESHFILNVCAILKSFVLCLKFKWLSMNKYFLLLNQLLFIPILSYSQSDNVYWPKQAEVDGFIITIYTPEPEKFENNILEARSAFSIFDKQRLPFFGAMWFQCRVQTNTSTNEVYFTDIQLMNADFSNANSDQISQLQGLIEQLAPTWHFNSDLKRFYKNIGVIDVNEAYSESLRHQPPRIFYSKTPAVLVYIDGDPVFNFFPGTELYEYIVNTPHFIVHSLSDNQYYLKGGDWWFTTDDLMGSWKNIDAPPAYIAELASKTNELRGNEPNSSKDSFKNAPRLIATNEPAILIQTNGAPEIHQVHENLFNIVNSDDEIIYDANLDYYFILVSGRWYKSKNLERGPWAFVAPEELPEYFLDIPSNASIAHVRLSIPGTPEAESAALDNGIPQTAVVDRYKASMNVDYDGDPEFEEIKGTTLKYAVNTQGSVIQTEEGNYYAVDQAIWFASDNPIGPWKVADKYPEEVSKIPPSCPVFNMKFVHIYDYSDDVVFVGYSGGYLGAFLYHGVVYYGTGYQYKSWYGDQYIPRPSTFGLGAKKKSSKSPNISFYAASGFGGPTMGMGFGGYPYGWGLGYGGYYGPWGWNMMNQAAYNQYYYAGQTDKVYADVVEEKPLDLQNIYNNRKEGIIVTETVQRNDPMKPVILKDRPHHLYADEKGYLYKQDREGNWFQLSGNDWNTIDTDPTN